MNITIDSLVARWSDPTRRPLFKGRLINRDGGDVCRCAQGDILHLVGWDDERLAEIRQSEADAAVAALLGISRAHSILLRHVNDSAVGRPQDVLAAPEKILGPHTRLVLVFWHHLDAMTEDDWRRVAAAGGVTWDAGAAIKNAAKAAARAGAWTTTWAAARAARAAASVAVRDVAWAAAKATNEIQGHEQLAAQGRPFVFLPMFGLTINDLATRSAQ